MTTTDNGYITPRPQTPRSPRRRVIQSLGALGLGALGLAGSGRSIAAVTQERCSKRSCPCRKHESHKKCKRRCKRQCDWM